MSFEEPVSMHFLVGFSPFSCFNIAVANMPSARRSSVQLGGWNKGTPP